jgi:hypothetical protein
MNLIRVVVFVRENAPHQQTRNCLTEIKIWLYARMGALFKDKLPDKQSVII